MKIVKIKILLASLFAGICLLCSFVILQQKPTLFMIGDSTMNNNNTTLWGWGTTIGDYLDSTKITLNNCGMSGRSTRTFIREGRWAKVQSLLKPGDFLVMGFGHIEGGPPDTTNRGVLKGIGEDSVILVKSNGQKETVHSYGWYIRKYIRDTKAKGATPIVVSMIPRREWDASGQIVLANKDFGLWAKQAAEQEGATFVDLNGITATKYNKLTHEQVFALFGTDHTHTNKAGATINSESFVEGLKLQPKVKLNNFLK